MTAYLSEMAALGVFGFDPLGAVIMLAFIAGGSRLLHTVVFTLVNWAVTVAVAVLGGLLFTALAARVHRWASEVPVWAWVAAEAVVAAALLAWAIVRMVRGVAPESDRPPRTASSWAVAAASAGFAVAAFVDPGYSAAIVLSAGHPLWETTAGMTLWFAITQSPLLVLLIAALCGRTEAAGRWLRGWMARIRRPVAYAITGLIVACVVLLAADAVLLSVTGRFLPRL
ncbi:hypothetical protein GSY69_05180 [Brevibacterium sp. 5221]|uniref:GAP family protein n=1 Tax=Brevibacterium rongguiense TaxID=2695267 RepID=A0A6N9H6J4_9MICO|nr:MULTISPECIES: hypothetical protein [Brevibacterium]MYM19376.1 hypothetical protein [Brevibacterium rongguiense]WAL39327.1 hypothetical protein BRM1_08515 [Brevibacterium sp. BRM-1]